MITSSLGAGIWCRDSPTIVYHNYDKGLGQFHKSMLEKIKLIKNRLIFDGTITNILDALS